MAKRNNLEVSTNTSTSSSSHSTTTTSSSKPQSKKKTKSTIESENIVEKKAELEVMDVNEEGDEDGGDDVMTSKEEPKITLNEFLKCLNSEDKESFREGMLKRVFC